MFAELQSEALDQFSMTGLEAGLAAGLGLGLTGVVEQEAEKSFRTIFGTDIGKGSLTITNVAARSALYFAEIVLGAYLMGQEGATRDVGLGIYAGGWWHTVRLLLHQTVGDMIPGTGITY